MAASNSNTVSLKLFIDPNSNRLLFAEAGKDFVDFLFSIMLLPVGTVIRLIGKQGTGCIGNIYDSIENLGNSYMLSGNITDILLKTQVFNYGVYKPGLWSSLSTSIYTKFYRCSNYKPKEDCSKYMANGFSWCPSCYKQMDLDFTFVNFRDKVGVGFVKESVTYMITDDLAVRPMSAKSIFTLLNHLNIKDAGDLEEKVIAVGANEGVELLRASMQTKTVLTAVFLGGKKESSIKSEPIH
ncbi:hypothetical protein ES332_D10G269200v1 [Gossypium tomentosum]|uniref:DUF674 domain-containing protein n=1 Tax=Gossypium tomentosum TaxID=34277 RepID=A0A5D2J9S8_GOSTO|nr:hypothetical protein ES332_D10G269200v1 [Gossypium tomentosum]